MAELTIDRDDIHDGQKLRRKSEMISASHPSGPTLLLNNHPPAPPTYISEFDSHAVPQFDITLQEQCTRSTIVPRCSLITLMGLL